MGNEVKRMQKDENLVKTITVYKEANVIVGGEVYISIEDAKVMLKFTEPCADEERDIKAMQMSRAILRNMAQRILFEPEEYDDESMWEIAQKYR